MTYETDDSFSDLPDPELALRAIAVLAEIEARSDESTGYDYPLNIGIGVGWDDDLRRRADLAERFLHRLNVIAGEILEEMRTCEAARKDEDQEHDAMAVLLPCVEA